MASFDDNADPITPPQFRLSVSDVGFDSSISNLPARSPSGAYSNVDPFSFLEPTSDLTFLSQLLINERCAPELLPFAETAVTNLQELIEYQESEISDVPLTTEQSFLQMLKSMELERVKYVVRSYLRTRLQKVEQYAIYLSSNQNEVQRLLSKPEKLYLQRYHVMLRTHLHDSALKHLPPLLQSLEDQSENVNMNIGDIQLPEDREPITMSKGELYLIRYIGIRDLLLQGKVELL